ncbi:MAG: hypothetical protein FWG22_06780, partial [Prolixibacteraceae bacterium]|nr:hypothetical protein [Prolixibacteraceae bacterium]
MGKEKKIAVFYYTQTGQALAIVQKVCEPLAAAGLQVIYKEIIPEEPFPFPWSSRAFFQAFPESRLAVPCRLNAIDLSDVQDADLVIVAGQSWYLSHSIPLHGFFQSDEIKNYLKGRKIVTVDGCRNMWVMKQLKTREYIHQIGAEYVGSVVLQDMAPNLVGVVTIIRWLFWDKKAATRILPAAGVSPEDIRQAAQFGDILLNTLHQGTFDTLQERFMDKKALTFLPTVYFIEKNGFKLWGQWARVILKKGPYQSPRREPALRLFKYYLFFVLYVISPFGLLFFYLTYPFRLASLRKARYEICYELGWNDNR